MEGDGLVYGDWWGMFCTDDREWNDGIKCSWVMGMGNVGSLHKAGGCELL